VARYLRRIRHRGDPAKSWLAFLQSHREVIAAFDFFTVPTVTFRLLYRFFVIDHRRRRVLHFNLTDHPNSGVGCPTTARGFPRSRSAPLSRPSFLPRGQGKHTYEPADGQQSKTRERVPYGRNTPPRCALSQSRWRRIPEGLSKEVLGMSGLSGRPACRNSRLCEMTFPEKPQFEYSNR
jgi:hypothetical protein